MCLNTVSSLSYIVNATSSMYDNREGEGEGCEEVFEKA